MAFPIPSHDFPWNRHRQTARRGAEPHFSALWSALSIYRRQRDAELGSSESASKWSVVGSHGTGWHSALFPILAHRRARLSTGSHRRLAPVHHCTPAIHGITARCPRHRRLCCFRHTPKRGVASNPKKPKMTRSQLACAPYRLPQNSGITAKYLGIPHILKAVPYAERMPACWVMLAEPQTRAAENKPS